MKLAVFMAILVFVTACSISAGPVATQSASPVLEKSFEVQSVLLGDSLAKVFAVVGIPKAVQIIGGGDDPGLVQLLYFKGEDTLSIEVTDLPENRVAGIEISGTSWKTTLPIKVGDTVDKAVAAIGTPDKVVNLTREKQWMLQQAGGNANLQKLIEKNAGDSALVYSDLGIYAEYDKSVRVIKIVRLFPVTTEGNSIASFVAPSEPASVARRLSQKVLQIRHELLALMSK